MYEAIEDHHVWLPRVKDYRYSVPGSHHRGAAPVTSFTTEQLKEQAVFQAQLDSRWSRMAEKPMTLKLFTDPESVRFTHFLPGGNHILVVYDTGAVRLKLLQHDLSKGYQLSDVAVMEDDEILLDEDSCIDESELTYTPGFGLVLVLTVEMQAGP